MKRLYFRLFTVAVCTVILLCAYVPSMAVGIDASVKSNLTVTLAPDGIPLNGAEFKIYRVGKISPSGKVSLVQPYSSFSVLSETQNAENLRQLAITLEGYVISNGTKPDYTAITDNNGKAEFEDISVGMYLVMCQGVENNVKKYIPESFIVTVPVQNKNGDLIYDIDILAKVTDSESENKTDLRVLKVWDDDGNASRPTKIIVEIYKGINLFDTITLNKENNWKYEFNDLPDDKWTVVEKDVPEGYKVTVERDGNSFIVTNKKDEDIKQTETSTPTQNVETTDRLPVTGMLWWPVPILAFAGLVMVMFGWRISRGNEDEG